VRPAALIEEVASASRLTSVDINKADSSWTFVHCPAEISYKELLPGC